MSKIGKPIWSTKNTKKMNPRNQFLEKLQHSGLFTAKKPLEIIND